MTKQRSPRKRNATLPRTYEAKREYMHYKASIEGKSLIHYIEDKAAPQRAVNAFMKAKDKLNDHDIESNH